MHYNDASYEDKNEAFITLVFTDFSHDCQDCHPKQEAPVDKRTNNTLALTLVMTVKIVIQSRKPQLTSEQTIHWHIERLTNVHL